MAIQFVGVPSPMGKLDSRTACESTVIPEWSDRAIRSWSFADQRWTENPAIDIGEATAHERALAHDPPLALTMEFYDTTVRYRTHSLSETIDHGRFTSASTLRVRVLGQRFVVLTQMYMDVIDSYAPDPVRRLDLESFGAPEWGGTWGVSLVGDVIETTDGLLLLFNSLVEDGTTWLVEIDRNTFAHRRSALIQRDVERSDPWLGLAFAEGTDPDLPTVVESVVLVGSNQLIDDLIVHRTNGVARRSIRIELPKPIRLSLDLDAGEPYVRAVEAAGRLWLVSNDFVATVSPDDEVQCTLGDFTDARLVSSGTRVLLAGAAGVSELLA